MQVYGVHIPALYTRAAPLHALTSIAHHFLEVDKLPYKLQPGGPGYEIVYSTTAVIPYLLSLDANANIRKIQKNLSILGPLVLGISLPS